ncbi:MAG TPA: hypothetical protein PL072_07190 [Phycisphaerales bacterium]|nr:hypothetical protein [Phycisphaerales bacterium]
MAKSSGYRITVKGTELTFEQTVSLEIAKKVVALAASGHAPEEDRPDKREKQEPADGAGGHREGGEMALSEYVAASGATRNIEKITAIGEYLRLYRSKGSFTLSDLTDGFEDAGDGAPGNLSRDVTWAKKAQWIAPKAGVDGAYFVTNTGRAAIGAKFSEDVKAKSKASAGGRKKAKKTASKAGA